MNSSEIRPAPDFEDVLTAAVDRQLSEQRALQDVLVRVHESLEDLRRALDDRTDALRGSIESGSVELAGLPDAVRTLSSNIRDRLTEIETRLSAPSGGLEEFAVRLTETVAALPEALGADVRAAIEPSAEALKGLVEAQRDSLHGISDSVESLRLTLPAQAGVEGLDDLERKVSSASEDVQALARAVLELNGGLREWSERLTERVESLSSEVTGAVRDLSDTQRRTLDSVTDTVVEMVAELRQDVGGLVRETARSLGARLNGVEEQLVEAGELTGYLRDQTEDLDKVLTSLGDVPQRLEGAVAQALRRALTVRAGLLAEAEKTLEKVFGPVSGRMEEMVGALESLRSVVDDEKLTDELRRMALRQVELDSRIDELEGSIIGELEGLADTIREGQGPSGSGDSAAPPAGPEAKPKSKPKPKSRSKTGAGTKKATATRSSSTKGEGKAKAKAKAKPKAKATAKAKAKPKAKTKTSAKAGSKSKSKRSASTSSRSKTRKSAGKTRTRDYIPV